MNIFRQLLIRKKAFSVLLIILIASSVIFSCIGCCAYSNAKNQIANISSSYTTLAVPVPADYDEIMRLGMIGWIPSDDENTHWADGTITYSKENIEKVVLQAPQLEKVEKSGLISAHLTDYKSVSSGFYNTTDYNTAFDSFQQNFCVLALKCTNVIDITRNNPEYANYWKYHCVEFEVLDCVSLMEDYGDITGKHLIMPNYYSYIVYNNDGSLPFEAGKQYLVRGFYSDIPVIFGVDYEAENPHMGRIRAPENPDDENNKRAYTRALFFTYDYYMLKYLGIGDEILRNNKSAKPDFFKKMTYTGDINFLSEVFTDKEDPRMYYTTYCEDALPLFAEYTGDWQDFLNTDEGKVWKDTIIPLAELNQNSVGVILTDNINSTYNFNTGVASILNGRAFSEEEYKNGSDVCIISASLALRNNLSVGDKISLDYYNSGTSQVNLIIRAFNDISDYYYTRLTLTPEKRLGIERECEIVGIYTAPEFTDGQYNFTADNIFVPKNSIPNAEQYENPDIAYLNSFVIKNGMKDDFEAYMAEHDMGGSFTYVDMNYTDALPALEALAANALRMLIIGCTVFAFVAVIGFYLIFRQMNSTIRSVRLIGVGTGVVRQQLCSALIGLSAVAVLLGAALGAALFKTITDAVLEASVEFSFGALALCCGTEFAVLAALAAIWSFAAANPNLMNSRKKKK